MQTHHTGGITWVAVAAVACVTLAGCGLGGTTTGPTKRFESEGFGITFEYPYALTEKALRGDGSSGKPDDMVRELTLTDDDFIAVRRDPMEPGLLAAGIDTLQPAVDQLAKVLDAHVGPGRPITVGGMPGFEYLDLSPDVQHRYLFFRGRGVLYQVHCRSTEQHRDEITAACDTVARTLHTV